jgi:hypothetical protein
LLGIPAGTALYAAVENGGPSSGPPVSGLLAMIAAMLVVVAGLTAVAVRLSARTSVAGILQAE